MQADPINFLSNGEMVTLCGAQVRNPRPVMMVELESRGMPQFNPLHDCAKCMDKAYESPIDGSKKYLYGVVEGEEAMHSGDTFNELNRTVDKFYRDDCA